MNKDRDSTRLLLQLVTGDPIQAMQSAKKIAAAKTGTDLILLAEIAANERHNKWARIAAIYAMGFLGSRASAKVLISILKNRRENSQIRSHAAEALGNMREDRASSILGRTLVSKEPPSIKKWCIYALSEIGTTRARSILKRFEATKPTGVVARELKLTSGKGPLQSSESGR